MSFLFPRYCHSNLPIADYGDGCYIVDKQGKRYLDGSGGAAVSCLGHSDPQVTEALKQQLDKIAFAHTGFLSSEPAEALAETLIKLAPEGIERVYLVSGGSEAVEASIKLARQYFLEIDQPQRHRVIARQQSYHGNTLGALAAGGNEWRRAQFAPLMVETSHIAPCYEYRGKQDGETTYEFGQRVANELETELLRVGPESVMAFIAEPVVGATSGAVPAVEGYFKRIREICDNYGVLLILDEVMCGMGRTGSLFACEQDGVSPDILTIAKGLGAGYQPIGAMLCSGAIYNAISEGSGFFQHGHTYMGHPMAATAASAVLTAITERDLLSAVNQQGDLLTQKLHEAFDEHPHIGDIRGRGLFRGIELVEDRDSKTPFAKSQQLNKKIKAAAFEAGLICYPMGGTIDGQNGDHILLAPPFIISNTQIDELVEKLSLAIRQSIN
ncbi:aspartate aminotransferase family protein [Leucothrix pacifica]|uniref:Aspartate aminotransferase family protein n=1 Tax=Leucothrix pacifica TaxID=1247513 RepID=A0A317CFR4_9GAMM|nr:aspartate aminotransferase family protein [Leucothrix pacifica]PWQ95022.1 aspartate aminotransferase family protein [Leucothrix pacifica]